MRATARLYDEFLEGCVLGLRVDLQDEVLCLSPILSPASTRSCASASSRLSTGATRRPGVNVLVVAIFARALGVSLVEKKDSLVLDIIDKRFGVAGIDGDGGREIRMFRKVYW